jgi:hypothetical protein
MDLKTVKVLGFKSPDIGWLLRDKNNTYSVIDYDITTPIEIKEYHGDSILDVD